MQPPNCEPEDDKINPLFWPLELGNMQLKHSELINHFQAGSIYNSSNVILGQILNVACDAAPGTRKEAHEGWLVGKGALFNMNYNTFTFRVKVVLGPMTRCRAIDGVPQQAHVVYYTQRATPGGLLITEASAIAPEAFGFTHSPGIFTNEHVEAWRRVVDAVHAKGAFIFCQIWHVGRASHYCHQPDGAAPLSPSSKAIEKPFMARTPRGFADFPSPRALATHEIPCIVEQFRLAAKNAIAAGFDGVEIHAAHGYLVDQFLKDGINDRTDEYGGSLENRCRFLMEVLRAVTSEIGCNRTSLRISPVINHLDATDSNPVDLGMYLVQKLSESFKLVYLHMTEPRFHAHGVSETDQNCQVYRNAYKGIFMSSGGYTRDEGMHAIRSAYTDLVSYGRLFLANPDLPHRFQLNLPLNNYDRSTFYTHDPCVGYTDYPTATANSTSMATAINENTNATSMETSMETSNATSMATVNATNFDKSAKRIPTLHGRPVLQQRRDKFISSPPIAVQHI